MNQEIKQQLESYFVNARDWYFEKYLRQKHQLVFLITAMLTLVVCFQVVGGIIDFIGQKTVLKFPIYVENDSDEQHYIKNLSQPNKSIDNVVAEYMVRRYVTLRQTYYPDLLMKQNWESLLMNLRYMSSHEVFDTLLKKLLPSQNPNSPLIRFRFENIITPYIKDIEMFAYSGNKPTAATVYFDSMKCNQHYESCILTNFVAQIRFEIVCKPDEFKFKVSYYKSYPVQSTSLKE